MAVGFGLHPTASDVWEWVQDCWRADYTGAPTDGSEWRDQCADSLRVLRCSFGGSDLPVSVRFRLDPSGRSIKLGPRLTQDL